jgi:protocatechuate 3,4-dioxygenase beta subunit
MLRGMMFGRLRSAAAVLLAMTFLASGIGLACHLATAAHTGTPDRDQHREAIPITRSKDTGAKPLAVKKSERKTYPLTVRGRAADAAAQPIKGATIYLVSLDAPDDFVAGEATTDAEGRYVLRDAPLYLHSYEGTSSGRFQVCGTAPGFGFAWQHWHMFFATRRPIDQIGKTPYFFYTNDPLVMDLTLEPEARLKGRIIDDNSKPISGVEVSIGFCNRLRPRLGEIANSEDFEGIRALPGSATMAKTDEEGRFDLAGLPSEACFSVGIEHPAYASIGRTHPGSMAIP